MREYELFDEFIDRFFSFAKKRHYIYIRRSKGHDYPWTNDPIFNTYKFTNVYRELDAGTIYCREYIRDPLFDHPELFFNIATYRRYNFIPTHQELGNIEVYKPKKYTKMMMDRAARGEQVFTGAHMLCGNIRDEYGDMPPTKVEQIFGISFKVLWERRRELEPLEGESLESAFNKFLVAKIPAFGPFICYEVITDLRWTRYLEDAPDIMTWANPGPGTCRGIQRLMSLETSNQTGKVASKEVRAQYPNRAGYIDIMRYLLGLSLEYLPSWMPPWEMREVEHTLCEWDKYERVRLGEGAPRQKFVPPNLSQTSYI